MMYSALRFKGSEVCETSHIQMRICRSEAELTDEDDGWSPGSAGDLICTLPGSVFDALLTACYR